MPIAPFKLFVASSLLALTGLAGCQNQGSHQTSKQAAASRYTQFRSGFKLKTAQQQFDTGDLDQSEKTLADAIIHDPDNGHLHLLAGRIALERGQLERANQRLDRAIQLEPALAEAHYFQGIVLQRWKQFDKAHQAYNKAFELKSDNVGFLLAVSEMLVALGRTDQALAMLESKIQVFDQSGGIRVAAGHVCVLKKDYTKAIDYLHQASLLLPDDNKVLEDLAMARLAAGKFADAIPDLQRVVAAMSVERRADLLHLLGRAQLGAGRRDDARATFIDITRQDREDVNAWVRLGEISLEAGDFNAALTAANRVIALTNNRPEGYMIAGIAFQKRKETDKALSSFDRAAQLSPNDSEPLIMRGLTLEQAGRFEAAAAAYAEAQRRRPEDARARKLLVQVEEKSR